MEFLSEQERYENGGLLRDLDVPLAVAALQLAIVQPDVEADAA